MRWGCDGGGTGPARFQLKQQIDAIALTSREFLKNIDDSVWAVNTRHDTLEGLATYLGHYATEYFHGTALHCELNLPANLPASLPAHPLTADCRHNVFLTFEEALNNALKHSGASRVCVEMSLPPKSFCVSVTDEGAGFILEQSADGSFKRAGTSQGMRNSNGAQGGQLVPGPAGFDPAKGESLTA